MKRFTLLTVLFLAFSFMGIAQEWHGITSDSPVKMKTTLVSSTEDEIVVNVNVGGFYTYGVTTPNGKQFVVSVDKMASMLEAGAPDLPMQPVSAIIGDRAEMKVTVMNSTYVDFENIEVAPSKGNFSRQINFEDVPYTYGEVYQQDAFWPATQAYLEAPYILRDFRGQNIMVRPFAYNPVTKTLRVYTSMTIAMTKVSDNGENQKASRRSNVIKADAERMAQYSRRFINFNETGTRYTFDEDAGEMLIICPDQYMSAMAEFVEWKNKSGRPTTLVSLTEAGGNNDNNIKNYITTFYNDPDHNLEFILLIGEYTDLTPHSMNGGRSDNWFGMLDGNDYYLEALTGRFSVQNAAQLQTHINKVLYYERDMPADVTWVDKGMGIGYYGAGSGHFGEDDYQHIDRIRDTLMHYTYTTVTEHHGGSGGDASVATISGTTNDGVSIINYCNHGSVTSWGVANYSTSNVNALTNDYKLPVVWSVACLNGQFDTGECFGEAWLRATNNSTSAPTGAVGGMFSWISQPWIPPMYGQDEMVDIFTGWNSADLYKHTLGGASLNGAMYILDAAPSDAGATQNTWLLFGDPSMMMRSANPTEMSVTASPAALLIGMTDMTITADVDYAIATLSMDGEIIGTGEIVNGTGTLTFDPLDFVGTADLVILGYNKVTYQGEIEIVAAQGPYLTVSSYEMSVPQANYGETVDLDIAIKNVGVDPASNLQVTLTTDCEDVTINNGESSVATIAPDETVFVEGLQFSVAEDVEDGTKAHFDVTITDGTNTWTGGFLIELHAPVVVFSNIVDNGQTLAFNFLNSGSAPFGGGNIMVTSCSPELVFDPETMTVYDSIYGGEILTMEMPYTIGQAVEPSTTFEVAYVFNSGFFTIEGTYVLTYQAIIEDFESGVFSSDWSFSTPGAWSIVNGGAKGAKCAKSMNGGMANSSYSATLTVEVAAAGNMTFMYKVSSEANYDKLHYYMDGVEKQVWSGVVDWTQYTQAVTVGTHTFKWEYTKDGTVNSNDDCGYIDDIVFPIKNSYTFIDPATDLEAVVDGHDVTLTWVGTADAASYVVKRDGELLAEVTDTEYSDVLTESGTYNYTVSVKNSAGSMSAPVSVQVTVDFAGVAENEVNLGIYPNPAESVLNINTTALDYEYQIVNCIGQVMMSGVANGNVELNVSSLENGVYFLKVVANGSTKVEKVVIK